MHGKRRLGTPRPFGYRHDHVTADPAEQVAVAEACAALVVTGMPSHTGHHIYRCTPPTRNRAWKGGHVARQAAPVEDFITSLVTGRLSRPDAADLVTVPGGGPDVGALRAEAAAPGRETCRPG